MAQSIKITRKDGTVREFNKEGHPQKRVSVEYRDGWVIVTDAWAETVAFPAADIAEVTTIPEPRGF